MQFAKGQIGAIIIIIAIVGTVFGGFMLNVNNVYSCTTNYKYITDVAGAFSGSSADMEVPYNPLANVTGYSVYDPIQGGGALDLVHGINYKSTKASESSGYWIQTIAGDAEEYNVTLYSDTDSTSAQMHYGDKTANIKQVKYAGRFHEETTPLAESYYSNLEVAGHTVVGVNLISVYDYITALKECGVNVEKISRLNFSTGGTWLDGYPGFMGHVSFRSEHHPGIIGVQNYIFTAGTYSSYITINPDVDPDTGELSKTTCIINDETLGAGDVYIAWGSRDVEKTLDLNGSSGGELVNDYIDPSQGVRPVTEHVTRKVAVQEDVYGTRYGWGAQFNFNSMNIADGTISYVYYDDAGAEHTETWARWTVTKPFNNPKIWEVQAILFPGLILTGTIDTSNVIFASAVLQPSISVDLSTGVWDGFGFITSEADDDTWIGPYCELIPMGKTYTVPAKGNVAKMISTLPTSEKGTSSYSLQSASCYIDGQSYSFTSDDQSFIVETHRTIYHTKTITYDTDVSYWYNGYDVASATLIVPKTLFDGSSPLGKDVFRIFWNTADGGYLYSDVTIELKSDGWYVNGIQIGNWPAVSVKIYRDLAGSPYLGVVPVMTFNNFMDYKTMDVSEIPIGLSVVDGDGKTVDDYKLTSFRMLKWDCNQATHRHEVVDTVLFLPSGGLYTQDGVFNEVQSFPNDILVKLRIMSAAHVGDGITITNSAGESVHFATDHVSNWVADDGRTCVFADLSVIYIDKSVPSVSIDGKEYRGGLYYTKSDGSVMFLEKGYLYYQFGTNGDIVRVGTSESTNDWSVTLNGVWAMSTSYSTGENVAESHMEWNGLGGVWGWNSVDTVLMFSGISMALLVLCAWRFELTGLDWILGLCAVLFPVIAWL